MTLRVIVADDAALSRDRLVRLLRTDPEVEVVAECIDGNTALADVSQLSSVTFIGGYLKISVSFP